LGNSFVTYQSVTSALLERFPYTLSLAVSAMIIAVIIGVAVGILSSIWRGKFVDYMIRIVALLGISTPVFWFGILLIMLFSLKLNMLPPSGMKLWDWRYLALPAVALGSRSLAVLVRMTRASMLEVLSKPYLTTARAKGISEFVVIIKQGLKNALIPIVTVIGLDFAS